MNEIVAAWSPAPRLIRGNSLIENVLLRESIFKHLDDRYADATFIQDVYDTRTQNPYTTREKGKESCM